MRDVDRAIELRKRIIDDWRWRRLSWQDITYKYRISKVWFYELRKRFLKHGYGNTSAPEATPQPVQIKPVL